MGSSISSGVIDIYGEGDGSTGFAALKSDGSVVTWGYSSTADGINFGFRWRSQKIVNNYGAFAALKTTVAL